MDRNIHMYLMVLSFQILVIAAQTNNQDYAILQSVRQEWENTPPSWDSSDPCRDWVGIGCTNSRVTTIILVSMSLTGRLSGDIPNLSELEILDLSYNIDLTGPLPPSIGNLKKLVRLNLVNCGFTGLIPDEIGSLPQLASLSLNNNSFSGRIPPSIGSLSNLYWLDLADNQLSGTIPVSNGTIPGLDLLLNTTHFHFGNNQLTGEIPSQLFSSNMRLIHLLFENNELTGNIPSTLGLVQTLEVVRLDRNSLSGRIPSNLNNLTRVSELYLYNNRLIGPLPDFTDMDYLNHLDMSNNTFDASEVPPWFSTLESLTTLMLENTQLQGQVPVALFSLPQLRTLGLRNNQLNGTLDIGSNYTNQLQVVNLQNNSISDFTQRNGYNVGSIILVGNPICEESRGGEYCIIPEQSNPSNPIPSNNCVPTSCSSGQILSPNCRCAYPYMGTLHFRSPSFSNLNDLSIYTSLQDSLMLFFNSQELPVDSVSLSYPTIDLNDYLLLNLLVFPSGQDRFNRTGLSSTGFMFSNQTFKPNDTYGPYYYIGSSYDFFSGESTQTNNSSSLGIIIGAAVGASVLALLLLLAGVYAFRQKRRAEKADKQNHPFALWDTHKSNGGVPQLKGARCFSFDELKKCANNFSEVNDIGSGGYGKVYRGTLPSGTLVAIKRAQQGSMQGALEFKTEIELLSRVHHKNVVSLVGFCFDQGEQMLVYEYIPNGTIKDSLSGRSGIRLDWMRRLRIALGAARGLQYLHDLADPPIIHRDIKSTNILLDERLNAKVADFGLSKLMGDAEKGYVTTQVKGTMGYMDPEYYMTQQLTEKSDVYSFGIVMLELVTARSPIEKGKHIVREVREAMDKTKVLYNLYGFLDSDIGSSTEPRGFERFVDLAMRCVEEEGACRPTMSEVMKEIESIMELAGLNPNAESAPTSASYGGASKSFHHPYSDESLFVYSGVYPPSKLEPK